MSASTTGVQHRGPCSNTFTRCCSYCGSFPAAPSNWMNGVNSACQGGQRDPLQESWKCTAVLRPILALVPLDLQCVALCSKVFTMPRNLKSFQMKPSEHDVIKTGRCVLCRRFVFETPMPVGRLVRQVADKHQVSWSNRATAYFLQGDATGNLTHTCSRLLNEMCRPPSPLGLGLIVGSAPSPAMCRYNELSCRCIC